MRTPSELSSGYVRKGAETSAAASGRGPYPAPQTLGVREPGSERLRTAVDSERLRIAVGSERLRIAVGSASALRLRTRKDCRTPRRQMEAAQM